MSGHVLSPPVHWYCRHPCCCYCHHRRWPRIHHRFCCQPAEGPAADRLATAASSRALPHKLLGGAESRRGAKLRLQLPRETGQTTWGEALSLASRWCVSFLIQGIGKSTAHRLAAPSKLASGQAECHWSLRRLLHYTWPLSLLLLCPRRTWGVSNSFPTLPILML